MDLEEREIELVEIAMNQTVATELDNQGHQLIVESTRIADFLYMAERLAFDKSHDDEMTAYIDSTRDRETSVLESL